MGLCAFSLALLFGGFGEPVAAADSDSISDTQGVGDQGEEPGTTETEPTAGTPGTGAVDTLPELLGIFGIDPQPTSDHGETQQESGGLTGPMALGGSTETVVSHTPDSSSESETSNGDAASLTNAEVNSLTSGEVNSLSDAEVNPPAGDPPAQEQTVVQPVTNAVASVDTAASSVPPSAAPPVVGAARANDVIKALAHFFIALTDDGVPYIKIPNDLLSLLGLPLMGDGATASSTAGAVGGSLFAGGGLYTAAPTQLARAVSAGWPEMLIAGDDSAALSSAGVVHPTPEGVGASGVVEQHSVGIKAVLADGIVPEQVRSVLQHTVDAVLAPLSVLALAALASPGVAGLLLLSAAGMFVGYRQARAASMLRAVGIARFAKSGPLGVVRSGSLITVHTRPSRASVGSHPERREFSSLSPDQDSFANQTFVPQGLIKQAA